MKKLVTVAALVAVVLIGCGPSSDNKYVITDADGNGYRTDNYETTEGGCVAFKCSQCGDEEKITICGSYKIRQSSN